MSRLLVLLLAIGLALRSRLLTGLPQIGEVVEAKREPDDLVHYSVTTIIGGAVPKPALVPWAVNVTSERTVDNVETIRRRLWSEGRDSAIDYVKGLRWQLHGKLSDADLGTLAHKLFDQFAMTGSRPSVHPELHPDNASKQSLLHDDDMRDLSRMLDQFERGWLQAFQPDYLATEVVVFEPEMGFAGQADGFAAVQSTDLIIDYKTSRKTYDGKGNIIAPYPEVAPQLAAYRGAKLAAVFRARRYSARSRRYYLLSPAERAAAMPVPTVEGGLAIRVTPDHIGVYPVACGERAYEAFLYMLEVARWNFNEASHAVGNAMDSPYPPISEPADDPFAGLPAY